MRTLASSLALALFVVTPALAQSQQSGSQTSSGQAAQQTSVMGQQELENTLEQAGIQDVRTLDAAYLVKATTKSGNQVTMVVDPAFSQNAQSNQAGSMSGTQTGTSGTQAGTSGTQAGTSGTQAGTSGTQAGTSGTQAGTAGTQASAQPQAQQQIRDRLTSAGFKNVQILDALYLAAGKTQNGAQVTMFIDTPGRTTGSTGTGGSQSSSGSSAQ
ncbi:hypothetical protein [Rhodoligotrophos defluvii]|uniref:hypothetical protein n=1 Tax=Rhodoligotrophos defluvii TaxID=2561934 RepID=UPI0014859F3D|nr:hypothetical protein [Rhodoligotrophos defluvii]